MRQRIHAALKMLLRAGLAIACSASWGAEPLFRPDASGSDLRFGAAIEAGRGWAPGTASPPQALAYGGRASLGCSGLDYTGYLRTFDADDLLHQLRDQLLAGAQAAAANYLIMLAYANPTIASVLDTLNQNYSARFGAFQVACNAQQARQQGLDAGARRLASTQDACYEAQVAGGLSPARAYQACANEATLGALSASLPASRGVLDFLREHSTLEVGALTQALLALLPDTRVGQQGLEILPPRVSLEQLNRRVAARAALAIDRVLAGAAPATISTCPPEVLTDESAGGGEACIPASAADLMQSGAFLAVRQLPASSRALYRDSLASQVALLQTRAALLELTAQIRAMSARPGSSAREVLERRRELEEQLALLSREADALQAWQQARASALRTQALATERAATSAASQAVRAPSPSASPSTSYLALRALVAH